MRLPQDSQWRRCPESLYPLSLLISYINHLQTQAGADTICLNPALSHLVNISLQAPRPDRKVVFLEDKQTQNLLSFAYFFSVWRDSEVSVKSQMSRLHEHPCWLYTLIALRQHSPLPRRFYPSENWLSSRCLTSVIIRELAFPYWLLCIFFQWTFNNDSIKVISCKCRKQTIYYRTCETQQLTTKVEEASS